MEFQGGLNANIFDQTIGGYVEKINYLKHYFRIALEEIVGTNIPLNQIRVRPITFTSAGNNATGDFLPDGTNNIITNKFYFGKVYGAVYTNQTFELKLWNKEDTLFNCVLPISGIPETGYTGFTRVPFDFSDVLFNYIKFIEGTDQDNTYLCFIGWEIELRDFSLQSSEV